MVHWDVGGTSEKFPEGDADADGKEHQIPIGYELLGKDFCHVASTFVAKFLKYRERGALARELEIDAVDEVDAHTEGVDDGIEPSCHGVESMPLLVVEWKEKEEDEQGIGIENGRRVENDARLKKVECVGWSEVSVCSMVDQHESQATYCIGYIHPKGVPYERSEIADKRKSFHAAKVVQKKQKTEI